MKKFGTGDESGPLKLCGSGYPRDGCEKRQKILGLSEAVYLIDFLILLFAIEDHGVWGYQSKLGFRTRKKKKKKLNKWKYLNYCLLRLEAIHLTKLCAKTFHL
jgi:hypothetical protein